MKKQIGWKKVMMFEFEAAPAGRPAGRPVILKLEILGDVVLGDEASLRYDGYKRKCRTSECKVLAAYYPKTKRKVKNVNSKRLESQHDEDYTYRVGAIQKPTRDFNYGPKECSSGIHFFEVRAWAENW